MRTSCVEGVAIHGDLVSCAGVREDAGEALTEGDVGWVIEPRNHLSGVQRVRVRQGNIVGRAISCQRTAAVREPGAYVDLQVREQGGPAVARLAVMAGRAARGTLRACW